MIGLKGLLERKPRLKVLIYAGKGGLGKTTLSAATSLLLSQNKKVLVFSTDPQASLSDVFERDVFGKGEVKIAENLYVLEIDADKRINEYVASIKKKIIDMYRLDKLPPDLEEYIDSAAAEPAMYESAVYDAMVDVVAEGKYDYYIFDMPPFGHGIRMIAMADVLSQWVEKITELRKQAYEYGRVAASLKRAKLTYEDEILKELQYIRDRIVAFRNIITDRETAALMVVVTPERMSILDTEKAIEMFSSLGLEVTGIVVNQVYPPELAKNPDTPEYIRNRVEEQRKYMDEIRKKFGDLVVSVVPMLNREPKGLEALSLVARELWSPSRSIEEYV
ncbi:Arsenite-transporting ATPase [Thermoproteus uzoniensis 768-20]|uniref:Arsenite-transporting ATPase n=1 Tax=Thermoproteus uzoniensis (strain 768-20) TaxID=999630 RepID=F2L0T3_THEU7|nr:TRC40/GET3/ArsA family transport-energizing ATPase [Thermoproteus uzoniensis]AEA12748.1 Arsenite-transporting ATPase [Thermoproteus uzoniensis 768-20]